MKRDRLFLGFTLLAATVGVSMPSFGVRLELDDTKSQGHVSVVLTTEVDGKSNVATWSDRGISCSQRITAESTGSNSAYASASLDVLAFAISTNSPTGEDISLSYFDFTLSAQTTHSTSFVPVSFQATLTASRTLCWQLKPSEPDEEYGAPVAIRYCLPYGAGAGSGNVFSDYGTTNQFVSMNKGGTKRWGPYYAIGYTHPAESEYGYADNVCDATGVVIRARLGEIFSFCDESFLDAYTYLPDADSLFEPYPAPLEPTHFLRFSIDVEPIKYYALVVGINNYSTSFPGGQPSNLTACTNDAYGIRDNLLATPSLWDSSRMTVLTNAEATKQRIRSELAGLVEQAGPNDVVLYYQSSHGGWISGTEDAFLGAYDDRYWDSELAEDLNPFTNGCAVVIILDACHSGGMTPESIAMTEDQSRRWDFARKVMARLDEKRREALTLCDTATAEQQRIGWMTACHSDQVSHGWVDDYSVFTYYLLQAFSAGDSDRDRDGQLSFGELFNYAYEPTIAEVQRITNAPSLPECVNLELLDQIVAGDRNAEGMASIGESGPLRRIDWQTSTDSPWFAQSSVTHDGLCAAQSGIISNSGLSVMDIEILGPGVLCFWYKVSSETNSGVFKFGVDSTNSVQCSGEIPWQQCSLAITSGSHVATWTYARDWGNAGGSDCAWVDEVNWTAQDSDGDGLPDGWEVEHSLDPHSDQGDNGANGDPDHDGVCNREEYVADTDPQNPNSLFQIKDVSTDGEQLVIDCQGGPLSWQVLECSTNLVQWFALLTNPPPNPAVRRIRVSAEQDRAFYRIKAYP